MDKKIIQDNIKAPNKYLMYFFLSKTYNTKIKANNTNHNIEKTPNCTELTPLDINAELFSPAPPCTTISFEKMFLVHMIL